MATIAKIGLISYINTFDGPQQYQVCFLMIVFLAAFVTTLLVIIIPAANLFGDLLAEFVYFEVLGVFFGGSDGIGCLK